MSGLRSVQSLWMGAACCIALVGCGERTPTTAVSADSESAAPALAVGDLITTSKFGIKVTTVDTPDTVGIELMTESPADGGKYVAVQWEYQNVSAKPIGPFSQPRLFLADPSGTRYEADVGASGMYAMQLDLTEKVLSDLNPGIKVRAASVFEVAESYLARPGWTIVIDADRKIEIPLRFGTPVVSAPPVAAEAAAPESGVEAEALAGTATEGAVTEESASGSEVGGGSWQVRSGEGVTEYYVTTPDDSSITIACIDDGPVDIMIDVAAGTVDSPTLLVDGAQFDVAWIVSDCNVCAENYRLLWAKLRTATSIEVKSADGALTRFPVAGIAEALPASPCAHAAEVSQ